MSSVFESYLLILNPAKCGSSWLAHGLTLRPFISYPREFDFFFFLGFPLDRQWNIETAEDVEYLRIRNDDTLTPDQKLRRLYEIEKERRPNVEILVDKAPSNINGFLDFRHLFRDTKTVVLHRDPRDVYISSELYHQRQLAKVARHDDIGSADYLRRSRVFEASMDNSEKVYRAEMQLREDGVEYLRITYEEMKQDFVDVLTRVIRFSGVEIPAGALVRSHLVDEPVPFAEHLRRSRDFRPRLFRKGIVGDWKNYITTEEAKNVVKDICGDLLIELGYEEGYDW